MTKQEVKDEFKEMEGDPRLKAERRQFGLKLRRRPRLDHAVLSADVIITNPTHFAVCLMYNPDVHSAPIVLAKGQRLRALKIKELAAHYGTPVVENKPVARALFATSEEGETIPSDLFKAVAEILAFIFEQKNKLAS
jgi:flagellar biosynthetic protein FlhB